MREGNNMLKHHDVPEPLKALTPLAHPMRLACTLIVIAFLAISVRLATILPSPSPLGGDEAGYVVLAQTLVKSREFRIPSKYWAPIKGGKPGDNTALRQPVYPVFLAAHHAVFGLSDLFPRITLIILDAIICCLLAGITTRVFGSIRAGLFAAAIWTFWTPAIFSGYGASSLYSETLVTFFLVAFMFAASGLVLRPTALATCYTGVLLALAILKRGYFLVLILFVSLWLAVLPLTLRMKALLALALSVGTVLPLVCWMLRNWAIIGEPFLSTQTYHLYLGNNRLARGST
jgi:hypothetical protein